MAVHSTSGGQDNTQVVTSQEIKQARRYLMAHAINHIPREDAEEVVQEALLDAAKFYDPSRGKPFSTYSFRSYKHRLVNYYRSRGRERNREEFGMTPTIKQMSYHSNGGFTRRRVQVLKLLSDDLSAREVADVLKISKRTVDFHMAQMHKALGVKSMHGAVALAFRRGILT